MTAIFLIINRDKENRVSEVATLAEGVYEKISWLTESGSEILLLERLHIIFGQGEPKQSVTKLVLLQYKEKNSEKILCSAFLKQEDAVREVARLTSIGHVVVKVREVIVER